MKQYGWLLTLISLITPSISWSEVYFGATIGQASSNDNATATSYSWYYYTNPTSETSDMTDTAYSVFFGYDFDFKLSANTNLAIEAGLTDLGNNSLSANGQNFGPAGTGTRTINVKASANATTLSLVATKRITEAFHVFGKLGINSWNVSGKITGTSYDISNVPNGSISQSLSNNGTDTLFGIGIEYKNIRLQYEKYKFGSSDTDYISIGYKM